MWWCFTISLFVIFTASAAEYIFNNITFTLDNNDIRIISSNTINDETLPHPPHNLICVEENIPHLATDSIANLTKLKRLILDRVNITTIASNAIYNVPKLKQLTITNNPLLRQLPRNAFNCSALRVLNLCANALETLTVIDGLPRLQRLSLSGNRLKTIAPELFANMPDLYDVHFSGNALKIIENNTFHLLHNKKNKINIYLDDNSIEMFEDGAFADGVEIDTLVLNGNGLEGFNGLGNVASVNWLELSNNEVECLDLGLMEKVKVLMVDENPWNCECLMGFVAQRKRSFSANAELTRCLFYEEM